MWAKAIGALVLVFALWRGWVMLTGHYEDIGYDRATTEMQKRVDEQEEKTKAAELQARENRIKAEQYHAELIKNSADYYHAISGSLRDIKTTVGGLDLSGAMANSGIAGDPAAVSTAVAEFKAAVSAFTDGVDRVADTCFADASALGGILKQAQLNHAIEGQP